MKKLNIILSLILCFALLAGCTKATPAVNSNKNEGAIKVVTTIFPVYDWVKNIGGNKVDVSFLINEGTDMHNYQPSAKDILEISSADMFIYVGGESDDWVEDTLSSSNNKNLETINLLSALSAVVKEEEMIEGMEADEHEREDGEEHEEDEEEGPEYDEHVWLSLKNADLACNYITTKLSNISPENATYFQENYNIYKDNLDSLNKEFIQTVKNANTNTLIFADRFPFRYFADDYNLNYYAAFVGCSAETEASFETISFLAEKADELNLHYIYKIEGANSNIAETVAKTSANNPEILSVNSMQSITQEDVSNGANYLKIMMDNLEVFKKGLSNE